MGATPYEPIDLTPTRGMYLTSHEADYGLPQFDDWNVGTVVNHPTKMPEGSAAFILNMYNKGSQLLPRPTVQSVSGTASLNTTSSVYGGPYLLGEYVSGAAPYLVFASMDSNSLSNSLQYIYNSTLGQVYEPLTTNVTGARKTDLDRTGFCQPFGPMLCYTGTYAGEAISGMFSPELVFYVAVTVGGSGTFNITATSDQLYLTIGSTNYTITLTNGATQTVTQVCADINASGYPVYAIPIAYYDEALTPDVPGTYALALFGLGQQSIKVNTGVDTAHTVLGLSTSTVNPSLTGIPIPAPEILARKIANVSYPGWIEGPMRCCFNQGVLIISVGNVLVWSQNISDPQVTLFRAEDFPADNYLLIGPSFGISDNNISIGQSIYPENIWGMYAYGDWFYVWTDKSIYRVNAVTPSLYQLLYNNIGSNCRPKGTGSKVFWAWGENLYAWDINNGDPRIINMDRNGLDRLGDFSDYTYYSPCSTTRVIGINADLEHCYFQIPDTTSTGSVPTTIVYDYADDRIFVWNYPGRSSANRVMTDIVFAYPPTVASIGSAVSRRYISSFTKEYNAATEQGDICAWRDTTPSTDAINSNGASTNVNPNHRVWTRYVYQPFSMFEIKNCLIDCQFNYAASRTAVLSTQGPTSSSVSTTTPVNDCTIDLATSTGNPIRLASFGTSSSQRTFLGVELNIDWVSEYGLGDIWVTGAFKRIGDNVRVPW